MCIQVTCGLLLLLSLAVAHVNSATCPNGWTYNMDSCYIFKHETYSWFDAHAECRVVGGYLAEDDNATEHAFLVQMVNDHGADVWLGFQDFAVEGVFVSTKSGQSLTEVRWASGEPNDKGHEEDCAVMSRGDGRWYDDHCEDRRRSFICEKSSSEESVVG